MKTDRDILLEIDRKIDKMKEDIHELEIHQIEIKKDLAHHVKRTDLLQNEVTHLSEKIKPIESIRFTWQNIIKLVALFTGLSSIATATIGLLKYLGFFH